MVFEIESKVVMYGITFKHCHKQIFDDDSNVFGRALEYRRYMHKKFPNASDIELIKVRRIKGGIE